MRIAATELEEFAATRCRQAGQNSDRVTGNIVAALFEHETSRALDPHLHTHCIILSPLTMLAKTVGRRCRTTRCSSRKNTWRTYYHELARALRACGYTIENSARGDFRVDGISPELIVRFSKRHRQIDDQTRQFLAKHPEKGDGNINDVREHLAHRLCSRKMSDLAPERLRALRQSQLTPADEPSLHVPSASDERHPIAAAIAVSWAEEHLFDRLGWGVEVLRGASQHESFTAIGVIATMVAMSLILPSVGARNEYGLAFVVGLLVSALILNRLGALWYVCFSVRDCFFFAPTNIGKHGLPKAWEKRSHREMYPGGMCAAPRASNRSETSTKGEQ